MLTTFDQVQDWIKDNGFKRWVLYKDASKSEKILDSAAFPVSDWADKVAMTEKYLRLAGGRAYAAGGTGGGQGDLNVTCEIRLQDTQPTSGNGGEQLSIGELTRTITESVTKQVRAEMEAQKYKDEKAAFEKEKEAFEQEKQTALGALIHYFAPIGQQLMQKHMIPKVAGIDAEEPVHVAQMMPIEKEEPNGGQEEQEDFTDDESQEIYALLVRFKKVEPDYLIMLRKVVAMAESGDATYTMAKGFLVK